MTKQLWLLAGGNGAGKSTFYHSQLAPRGLPFVNADIIASELYPDAPELHSYKAAQVTQEIRERLLLEGRSFCFETVFSHRSKIDFVAQAKAFGYQVVLVFVHLQTVGLNKARVAQRVASGGHNVPDEKVETRLPRLLTNIKTVLPLCDYVRLLDNSYIDSPFQSVVTIAGGKIQRHVSVLPLWAEQLLAVESSISSA